MKSLTHQRNFAARPQILWKYCQNRILSVETAVLYTRGRISSFPHALCLAHYFIHLCLCIINWDESSPVRPQETFFSNYFLLSLAADGSWGTEEIRQTGEKWSCCRWFSLMTHGSVLEKKKKNLPHYIYWSYRENWYKRNTIIYYGSMQISAKQMHCYSMYSGIYFFSLNKWNKNKYL